jgi:hypothetical protein
MAAEMSYLSHQPRFLYVAPRGKKKQVLLSTLSIFTFVILLPFVTTSDVTWHVLAQYFLFVSCKEDGWDDDAEGATTSTLLR